jgi:hypothetical protein
VIRRGFWLAAGAVTGIYGYRRVSAAGRRLSASLNPAEPAAALPQSARSAQSAQSARSARLARQGRRTAIRAARETYRFTCDVREGMDLYMARHSAPAGSTLGARDALGTTNVPGSAKTNHDPRPKDGH